MLRVKYLLLVLFVSGCTPKGPIDVDFTGPDFEYVYAVQAAEAWNQTCGLGLVTVRRGEGLDIDMRGVDGPVDDEGHVGKVFRGGPFHKTPVRILYDRTAPVSLVAIMAHEFGHALGLPHTDYGLMRPEIDLYGEGPLPDGYISPEQCAAVM